MSNKVNFKSRKDATEFLKTKGIDTSSWTKEKWQSINTSQAEIHIQALAESMWDAMNESTPRKLKAGEWNIPFGDNVEYYVGSEGYDILCDKRITGNELSIKISTARCARLSYMTHDGEIDYEKDIKLHDGLLRDKHMSPFEHCAKAMNDDEYYLFSKGMDGQKSHEHGWCNNFRGWIQYRYLVENNIKS